MTAFTCSLLFSLSAHYHSLIISNTNPNLSGHLPILIYFTSNSHPQLPCLLGDISPAHGFINIPWIAYPCAPYMAISHCSYPNLFHVPNFICTYFLPQPHPALICLTTILYTQNNHPLHPNSPYLHTRLYPQNSYYLSTWNMPPAQGYSIALVQPTSQLLPQAYCYTHVLCTC